MMKGSIFALTTLALIALVAAACLEPEPEVVTAFDPITGNIGTFADDGSVPDGWFPCDASDCADVLEDRCMIADCGPALGMPAFFCADGSLAGNTGNCLRGADGGCGWEILECPGGGSDGCAPDDCGPPLGMPSILCDDGSIGGSTGNCYRTAAGECRWEIRECPSGDDSCDPSLCGPPLGMPTIICEDGSIAGSTGRCITNADGSCGWEILECPGGGSEECPPGSCGAPSDSGTYYCPDGTIAGTTGRCVSDEEGSCQWETRQCPGDLPTDCALDECGPAPGMPAWICEDGSIGGNTGRCYRDETGLCRWEIRDCPGGGVDGCAIEDCGRPLGMPTIICDDGSLAGNTGRCILNDAGDCGWEILECPRG